jgi:hypothetical protein
MSAGFVARFTSGAKRAACVRWRAQFKHTYEPSERTMSDDELMMLAKP